MNNEPGKSRKAEVAKKKQCLEKEEEIVVASCGMPIACTWREKPPPAGATCARGLQQ